MASVNLSPKRAQALFDILSHHEAYQELREFRIPGTLSHFGPPFKTESEERQTPLVHSLFSRLIAPLPGLRDVSADFWQAKCQEIVNDFAKADLSESYEAGYIGIRKTLATAAAAIIEAPARGYYGGFAKSDLSRKEAAYDTSKPEDVVAAFNDFLQRAVYEDIIDEIFAKAAETNKLSDHDPLVQSAHEHILLVLASFIHYILFISPDGQTLLTMIKRANALVPYTAIRQTLKVGNAATMINGMMKIFLTKMTINSVTTFLGLTAASDSGWNLLQTIISTVVNWDTNSLKQRSTELTKNLDGPSKEQYELLKAYVDMGREEHDKCRMMSEAKEEPIAVTVMDEYDGDELSETQIPLALEYLSIRVSIRDRKQITGILCSKQPDLLTQAIHEGIAAYDPVIRALHNAVDLSGTVGDLQVFLDDLLKFAPSSKNTVSPTVKEIVELLRKHQGASHSFIHQVCKNGPELSSWYKEYVKNAVANFRVDTSNSSKSDDATGGAGKLTSQLEIALSTLSEKQRSQVLAECDAHAIYLASFVPSESNPSQLPAKPAEKASIQPKSGKASKTPTREPSPDRERAGPGPGQVKFLARWQAYINETAITPSLPNGPVRHGGDRDVVSAGRGGSPKAQMSEEEAEAAVSVSPACVKTVELLGGRFREILRRRENSS